MHVAAEPGPAWLTLPEPHSTAGLWAERQHSKDDAVLLEMSSAAMWVTTA